MLVKDRPHSQSLPEEHGAQSVSPTMSSTVPEPAPYLDSVTELLRTTISFLSPEEGRTAAGEGIDLLWKRFVALLEPRLQDLSSEELAVPGAPPGTGVVLLVHQAHQFIEQLVHGSRDSTEPLLREALRESLYGVQRWSLSATDREEIPDTLRGERTLEGRASRAFQNIDPSSTGATRATIAPDPAPVFRGRIETDDDFFRTRMPIERAQIVISSAAHLLEAHHFFALLRAANPEDLSIPTESELVTRTPLPGKREGERAEKEADITIHLSPDGSTVLPVPFGAEVVAVELSPPQEGGEPLFLEYSVFGPVTLCGLSEEVEVTIRLQRSAQAHITDPDLLARIRKHLPSFEVPLSPGIRALFAEAQTHFDEVQRTELVGSYARSHAPLYTQDPLSQQLLDYSGENGLAFLEGHGGGTCLTMAARVSNLTNLSGGAGYVVCGPVVQNNRFVVVPGHAQGATLRSDAALWQDLTIAAHRPDPKNVQQISEEEQQVLLEEVFEHQPEDVRRAGRACRELLLRPVEKKEGSQKTITRREQNGHTFREADGDLWVGKRPRQRFPENVHTELLQ
ncbi:hypothetical protein MRY87_09065, partial [bacterium]|nr:hypothetical protein [bacterium]